MKIKISLKPAYYNIFFNYYSHKCVSYTANSSSTRAEDGLQAQALPVALTGFGWNCYPATGMHLTQHQWQLGLLKICTK